MAAANYKRTLRLACRRLLPGPQHRQSNEPPPIKRTRNTAKLAVLDPTTGHTVYGQHALATWRNHMQLHLTDDKPNIAAPNAPNTAAQQIIANTDEENSHSDNTSPTLTSGSDTSEAMHIRRARIGTCRHSLLEQASSDDDTEHITTAPATSTPQTATPRSNSTRQSTLPEFFSDN